MINVSRDERKQRLERLSQKRIAEQALLEPTVKPSSKKAKITNEVETLTQEIALPKSTKKRTNSKILNNLFEAGISEEDARTRQAELLHKTIERLNTARPIEKIKGVEHIFAYFKENNFTGFNSSEIWTSILKNLVDTPNINLQAKISLDIADNNNSNTTLTVSIEQLNDFFNAFKYPNTAPQFEDSKNRNIINFLNSLDIDKPYFKIINQEGFHLTGLVIEKKGDDEYSISHLNSLPSQTKTKSFSKKEMQNELLRINFLTNSHNNLFNEHYSYQIPNNDKSQIDTEYQTNPDFTPYSQNTNCCHQISVINLLKYYLEEHLGVKQETVQTHRLIATRNPNKPHSIILKKIPASPKNDEPEILHKAVSFKEKNNKKGNDCKTMIENNKRFQELKKTIPSIKTSTITSIYGRIPKKHQTEPMQHIENIINSLYKNRELIKTLIDNTSCKINNLTSILNGAGAKAPEVIKTTVTALEEALPRLEELKIPINILSSILSGSGAKAHEVIEKTVTELANAKEILDVLGIPISNFASILHGSGAKALEVIEKTVTELKTAKEILDDLGIPISNLSSILNGAGAKALEVIEKTVTELVNAKETLYELDIPIMSFSSILNSAGENAPVEIPKLIAVLNRNKKALNKLIGKDKPIKDFKILSGMLSGAGANATQTVSDLLKDENIQKLSSLSSDDFKKLRRAGSKIIEKIDKIIAQKKKRPKTQSHFKPKMN